MQNTFSTLYKAACSVYIEDETCLVYLYTVTDGGDGTQRSCVTLMLFECKLRRLFSFSLSAAHNLGFIFSRR